MVYVDRPYYGVVGACPYSSSESAQLIVVLRHGEVSGFSGNFMSIVFDTRMSWTSSSISAAKPFIVLIVTLTGVTFSTFSTRVVTHSPCSIACFVACRSFRCCSLICFWRSVRCSALRAWYAAFCLRRCARRSSSVQRVNVLEVDMVVCRGRRIYISIFLRQLNRATDLLQNPGSAPPL